MAGFDLAPGAVFAGKFRVRHLIGEGGMGCVYAAEHVASGRPCALKLMRTSLARDPRLRERFELEARVGARIRSEYVVQVIDAGIDEATGVPWLAMELLEGEDLASLAGRLGLAMPHMRELFAQLGIALTAAHAAGVVHRDLKPENVFVARSRDRPFAIKILDFGLAKVVHESAPVETTPVGTVLWMAPEQTESDAAISPAADLWALGLLAFWLVTGRYYWKAAEPQHVSVPSLLRELIFDPIEPASRRAARFGVDHLPPAFDAWFAQCVVRSTQSRFHDTAAAFAALDAVLARLGTPPPRPATRLIPTAPTVPLLVARASLLPVPPGASVSPVVSGASAPPGTDVVVRGPLGGAVSVVSAPAPVQMASPAPRSRGRVWLVAGLATVILALGAVLIIVVTAKRAASSAPAAHHPEHAPNVASARPAASPEQICAHLTAVLGRKPQGHAHCLHEWSDFNVDLGYRVLADCLLESSTAAEVRKCETMRRPRRTRIDASTEPAEP